MSTQRESRSPQSTPATLKVFDSTARWTLGSGTHSINNAAIIYSDLEDIDDVVLREKVKTILNILKDCTIYQAVNMLHGCNGSVDNAVRNYFDNPPQEPPEVVQKAAARSKRYPSGMIPSIALSLRGSRKANSVNAGVGPIVTDTQVVRNTLSKNILPGEKIRAETEDKDGAKHTTIDKILGNGSADFLYELLPSTTRKECARVLKLCDGDSQMAFECLEQRGYKLQSWEAESRELDVLQEGWIAGAYESDSSPCNTKSNLEKSVAKTTRIDKADKDKSKKVIRQGIFRETAFNSRTRKRASPPDSLDGRRNKKTKVGREDDEGMLHFQDASSGGDEDEAEPMLYEAWIKKTYPEKSGVFLLFGDDKVIRDTIPMRVLTNNFEFFENYVNLVPSEGSSIWRITIFDVKPESFDLLMHFVVCSTINTGFPKLHTIDCHNEEITALLDLKPAAVALGLEQTKLRRLNSQVVSRLRTLLVDKPRSLKGSHIKKAFTMADSYDIRQLFVRASARPWMERLKGDGGDENVSEDDGNENEELDKGDYDEEDLNAAQQESFGKSSHSIFHPLILGIPDFKMALALEIMKTTGTRERPFTKTGKKSSSRYHWTDPLTQKPFEL